MGSSVSYSMAWIPANMALFSCPTFTPVKLFPMSRKATFLLNVQNINIEVYGHKEKDNEMQWITRMHSSGIHTVRLLTVSHRWVGCLPVVLEGVSFRGGGVCLWFQGGCVADTPQADTPLAWHSPGQTQSLPSAYWDTHPLSRACWDTPPCPMHPRIHPPWKDRDLWEHYLRKLRLRAVRKVILW